MTRDDLVTRLRAMSDGQHDDHTIGDEAADEIERLQAGWLPIEIAPRDGTWILLWDQCREVAVSGCWHDEPGLNSPNGYEPGWSWWSADDDLVAWDSGPDDAPTHWMPLPQPPKECTR